MTTQHRRTFIAFASLAFVLGIPTEAFACWSICAERFGGEFYANGTLYQLTSCTQTWPDGASQPNTVCRYTNVYRPTNRM